MNNICRLGLFQVWFISLLLAKTLRQVLLKERTCLQWTMGVTTLLLLLALISNTSLHLMESPWTGLEGEFLLYFHCFFLQCSEVKF